MLLRFSKWIVVCALLAGSAPWLMYLCGVAYVENGMLFFGMLSLGCLCLQDRLRRTAGSQWPVGLLAGLFAGLACGFKYTAVAMIAIPLFAASCILSVGGREDQVASEGCQGSAGNTEFPRRMHVAQPLLFILGAVLTFSPWLVKNALLTGNPVFPLAYDVFGARQGVWTDDLAARWARGHRVQREDESLTARLTRFKDRVLTDRRLGWWLVVVSVPILFGKARTRLDLAMFAIFILQSVVWIGFTHLFARFAVVMLIPLCILAGRSVIARPGRLYRGTILVTAVGIVVFNLFSAGSIYAAELRNSDVHGHVEWFYSDCDPDRTVAGFVHLRLSRRDRLLMVGEARAFYMPENVDYHVVFNRNPLAEAVAEAREDEDINRWLNEHGYTHLLVNWTEMERLRKTYGFWGELTAPLFQRLEEFGLAVVKRFRVGQLRPYATLYEVRHLLPTSAGADLP